MHNASTKTIAGIAIADILLLAAACTVPALSHALALPLYVFNPMLALLLAGILLGRDWRNGLALAVLMPLLSCILVGMPTAPKMLCMMAELATVAVVFGLLQRSWKALPAVFAAVLAGKVVYYAIKALVLAPAVLVSTAWYIQLGSVVLWCTLFALVHKLTTNN